VRHAGSPELSRAAAIAALAVCAALLVGAPPHGLAAQGLLPPAASAPRAFTETLTVQVHGVGTPVLLIPGLFGSAYGYRNVVPLLTDSGYQTIVIEPLAMGASSRPPGADYSLWAQAARIAAVLDTLHLRGLIVVGHSLGAAIAFRLALQRPDLVRAIVSLEGGPAEAATTAGFRHAMALAPLVRLLGARFFRGRIRRGLVAVSGDAAWVTNDVVAAYTVGASADLAATLRAYRRMGEAREPELLGPRLGEVLCRVRLLLGGVPHNGSPSAAEQELMRRSLAGFSTDSVSGAGFYLQEERPDLVAAAVRLVAEAAPAAPAH
jgi:pimeloyl-ACP methyl ester carboxylesterase